MSAHSHPKAPTVHPNVSVNEKTAAIHPRAFTIQSKTDVPARPFTRTGTGHHFSQFAIHAVNTGSRDTHVPSGHPMERVEHAADAARVAGPGVFQCVPRLSAPSVARNRAGSVIQRVVHGTAGNSFEHYVLARLGPFMFANGLGPAPAYGAPGAAIVAIATWLPALQAARRLDHRWHRQGQQVDMYTGAVTPSSLLTPVAGGAAVPGIGGGGVHLQEMDLIQAFLVAISAGPGAGAGLNAAAGGAHNSVIHWGGLRQGFGTKVEATLLPGGEQLGSSPSILASAAWNNLTRRKRADGVTLYAMGHLLHDGMGGPGLDFNLVPLTNDTAGGYGANNANLAHRQLVEGSVLDAYRDMHGVGVSGRNITQVRYGVAGDFTRPARAQTALVNAIAQGYLAERNRLKGLPVLAGGTGGAEPTHAQVLPGLAVQVAAVNAAAVAHINSAMDALRLVYAAPAINGVVAILVHSGLSLNATIWAIEDQVVPAQLLVTYDWIEDGVQSQTRNRTVDVDLPNSVRAPVA